jgi:nitrite reductase (NADH) small subunit
MNGTASIHLPQWIDVGRVDEIPLRGARTVPVEGGPELALFRTGANAVHALVNACPHKKGPLSQGIVHGNSVTCPLHSWVISLSTGEAQGGDIGCTPVIPVKIDGGRILICRQSALDLAA